jgi:hypothetical protein
VEAPAVGQPLPDMPGSLTRDASVPTPVEAIHMATWEACPAAIRELLSAKLYGLSFRSRGGLRINNTTPPTKHTSATLRR